MTQLDVLKEVLGRLHELGIAYALTGSHASTYWGEPRSTHDIDLVLVVSAAEAEALAEAAGPDYYADPQMAREAPGHTNHFNFIHHETGIKVDFWVLGQGAYDRQRFARRLAPDAAQPSLVVLAPEDVILSKLLWARLGADERQPRDIAAILRLQSGSLDLQYLRRWAAQLGLSERLETLLAATERQAGPAPEGGASPQAPSGR